jgi:hypothetical protein
MSDIPWGEYGDTELKPFPSGSIFKGLQVGFGVTTNPDSSLDLNMSSISALILVDCTQIPTHTN